MQHVDPSEAQVLPGLPPIFLGVIGRGTGGGHNDQAAVGPVNATQTGELSA
jgi:hypothetical protein